MFPDPVSTAHVARAHAALTTALDASRGGSPNLARQFVAIARGIAGHQVSALPGIAGRLGDAAADFCERAAVGAEVLDSAWAARSGQDLARAYLSSIAPGSLLDTLLPLAQTVPMVSGQIMVASDATSSAVDEGDPKPLVSIDLAPDDLTTVKVAALVVTTAELARATDGASSAIFERELRTATLRGLNDALVALVMATAPAVVTRTGNAVDDLAALLAAAADSAGYVVGCRGHICRELALRSDGRMGVNGGSFVPGVTVVRLDSQDTGQPEMIAIPADRVIAADDGLRVRPSSVATVAMRSDPTAPAEVISLWQSSSAAILLERQFKFLLSGTAAIAW